MTLTLVTLNLKSTSQKNKKMMEEDEITHLTAEKLNDAVIEFLGMIKIS